MRHDQVVKGTAAEPVYVVKAHDDLRVEGQVPVHLGLEHQQLLHIGQDLAPRPRLHRAHDVELPGVHRVGYRGLPGSDHLIGREPARPQVHVSRADDLELLADRQRRSLGTRPEERDDLFR